MLRTILKLMRFYELQNLIKLQMKAFDYVLVRYFHGNLIVMHLSFILKCSLLKINYSFVFFIIP